MFHESKEFIKSKTRGSKGTALAKALSIKAKMREHKEKNKEAHDRIKREGVDFNKI